MRRVLCSLAQRQSSEEHQTILDCRTQGGFHRLYDWTAGCIAVTDDEIEEIWSLVTDGTPVEIKP